MAVTLSPNVDGLIDPRVLAGSGGLLYLDGAIDDSEDVSWCNVEPTTLEHVYHQGYNPAKGYTTISQGADIPTNELEEGYPVTYSHASASNGLSLSRQTLLTIGPKLLGDYIRSMGAAYAQRHFTRCYSLMNNAFSASYLGGDAVALCSGSHPTASVGTVSNTAATALDWTSLMTSIRALENETTPDGLYGKSVATDLWVPLALNATAYELTKGAVKVGLVPTVADASAAAGIPSYITEYGLTVHVSRYLTSATRWFLGDKRKTQMIFNMFVLQGSSPVIDPRQLETHNFVTTDLVIDAVGFTGWRGFRGNS